MKKLTERQRCVLEYVKYFHIDKGYPPSLRQISHHFDISISASHNHIKALEKKSYLKKENGVSRSITVCETTEEKMKSGMVDIPVVNESNLDNFLTNRWVDSLSFSLPANLIDQQKNHFGYWVKDDGMKSAGIDNDDFAIFRQEDSPIDSDLVLVYLDGRLLIKRFYRETSRICLRADDLSLNPVYLAQVEVFGKLILLIKNYG